MSRTYRNGSDMGSPGDEDAGRIEKISICFPMFLKLIRYVPIQTDPKEEVYGTRFVQVRFEKSDGLIRSVSIDHLYSTQQKYRD